MVDLKMHFLSELVKKPILEDPFKQHLNIHRHFYRYSKGVFIGPALKISKTKAKITMKGAHEYEDLILETVTNTISTSQEIFEINGKLISGSDMTKTISELGLNWVLKKSTGKTKNYKADIVDQINKVLLLQSIDVFRENSYLLLSYNRNTNCKVTTKKNIPQPSKKKVEDDEISKRIQFCTGMFNNTDANLEMMLDLAVPDFKSELPNNWKSLIILNNYNINQIEIPTNVKDTRLLRIMGIRKGKMIRSLEIDGDLIEKQYSIVV
ncbi:MAG: hypothetical protein KGD68_07460 [Candidatus Lokiarchaeota archaeon]|nr:hypothetical protein [Candidatus Lokiarchaeota archaeon]